MLVLQITKPGKVNEAQGYIEFDAGTEVDFYPDGGVELHNDGKGLTVLISDEAFVQIAAERGFYLNRDDVLASNQRGF